MSKLGHEVLGLDVDEQKIELLRGGEVPFYEPGLAELLTEELATGRLHFTTSFADAGAFGEVHFVLRRYPAEEG